MLEKNVYMRPKQTTRTGRTAPYKIFQGAYVFCWKIEILVSPVLYYVNKKKKKWDRSITRRRPNHDTTCVTADTCEVFPQHLIGMSWLIDKPEMRVAATLWSCIQVGRTWTIVIFKLKYLYTESGLVRTGNILYNICIKIARSEINQCPVSLVVNHKPNTWLA